MEERLSALRPSWVRVFTDTTWWVSGERHGFVGPMVQALLADLRLYGSLGTRANLVMWRPLDWSPDRYADLADHLVALLSWLRLERDVDVEVGLLGQASRALRYQLDESSVSDAIAQQRTVLRPRPARIADQRTLIDVVPAESMVVYRLPPALAGSPAR
ncbi:hypothetical protein ACWDWO_24115 [Actinopolymorpha singaporensis]